MKIDIGCGPKKKDGFVGIDMFNFGQEVKTDVEKGLPFSDNSVDEIYCSHLIEHIKDWALLFNEMWRVGKDKALITLRYPSFERGYGFLPYHITFYSHKFFKQITSYDESTKTTQILKSMGLKARFELVDIKDGVNDTTVVLRGIK